MSNTNNNNGNPNKKMITISVRLFDEIQRKRTEQAIKMFNKIKSNIWELRSAAEASVVIFSLEDPGGEHFLKSCRKNKELTPVVFGTMNDSDCPWFIDQSADSSACMKILSQIASTFIQDNSFIDPEESVAGYCMDKIKRHVENNEYIRVDLHNNHYFYINRKRNQVYFDQPLHSALTLNDYVKKLQPLSLYNTRIKSITKSEFSKASTNKRNHNFNCFLWELVFAQNSMSLLDGINHSRFKLKKWPLLTQVKHDYNIVILSAFLIRFSSDITTIIEKTKISKTEVLKFINAAFLTDILVEPNSELIGSRHPVNLSPKVNRSLAPRILKRIL
ncbi:MAG: hypothetical protein AAGB12_10235 [Pseudomonadota bacterium]